MADIIVDGQTRVAFVPTIANIAAPTTAELNAGTLLQSTLIPAGLEGFENTTADVDNTSLASTFDTKLPGRQSFSGTGLVLKKQDGTDTVFNLLSVPNTAGYIVIRDGVAESTAWAATNKVEVYPIRTAAHSTMGRGEANSLLRYRIPTPISAAPNLKAVVA
ncbi:MAG: hypothetical protein ABIR39_19795 [Nocardioides sp.]|uniref:phage tail tube protein n=1 Tax=Nocardioides sp. TaxID=35761 RepID=UPI0032662CAA